MIQTIVKLWMALNSAQKTTSLSLAIAFGMIIGLTPTANIHNLIILAIVFFLNIHFGFFFLSIALFSVVGFGFDPLFDKLGYYILQDPSLNSIFTTFYNMPFARLTNFNNTIVMGSLVSSLALFIPTYFLFSFLIKTYRDKVALKLSKFKYAKWFGFYNQEKKEQKQSPIRWWGLGLFAIIVSAVASFFILLLDVILKFIFVTILSIVSNRDVIIDSLNTDILDAKLNIKNIYFLNEDEPNINDLEIGKIDVDIDLEKLFYKKTVIELANIGGIKFSTKSKVYREKKQKSKNNFLSKVAIPSAEFILSNNKLDIISASNSIKSNSSELKKEFEDAKKSYESKEYEKIISDSKALLKKIKTTKDISKLPQLKKDYNKLEKEINALKNRYQNMTKSLYDKQKKLIKDTLNLNSIAKADYKRLLSKYSLSSSGAINVIGDFNSKYKNYLLTAWGYYKQLKPYLDDGEPKKPVVKRKLGYNVRFRDFSPSPDFWLKKATLDAIYKDISFDGIITNISTNHKLVGRPAVLNIDGKSKIFKSFNIRGVNDGRVNPAVTFLDINTKGYKLAKQDFDNFILEESNVNMNVNLKVVSDKILLKSQADFLDSKLKTTINEEFIKNILASITSFDIKASGYISDKENGINLSSNLDRQIADGFKKELKKELEKLEVELKAKINNILQEKLKEINLDQKDIDKIKKFVDKKELDMDSLQEIIKKELEKRAKEIAKKEIDKGKKIIEDRAKKELKKLLNF